MKLVATFALAFHLALGASAYAKDRMTVTPTSLAFGNLTQGQAKSLTLVVKSEAVLKLPVTVKAPAPYTASPAQFELKGGAQQTVTITLPATATAGSHSGTIAVEADRRILPDALVNVAVSGTVAAAAPVPLDLSGTGQLQDCSVNGSVRTCTVLLNLTTTGSTPLAAKTQVFESRDGGPENKTMDITTNYTPAGGFPFGYGIQQLPVSVHKVVLRVVLDSANQVTESNETNNQFIVTLNF